MDREEMEMEMGGVHSLRWHYPDQVPGVDEPTAVSSSQPKLQLPQRQQVPVQWSMLRRRVSPVNALPPPIRRHTGGA